MDTGNKLESDLSWVSGVNEIESVIFPGIYQQFARQTNTTTSTNNKLPREKKL